MPESLESKAAAARNTANANKKSETSRRRSKAAPTPEEKPAEPQEGVADVPPGPFIPNDL
jgi:hypothetical protein